MGNLGGVRFGCPPLGDGVRRSGCQAAGSSRVDAAELAVALSVSLQGEPAQDLVRCVRRTSMEAYQICYLVAGQVCPRIPDTSKGGHDGARIPLRDRIRSD